MSAKIELDSIVTRLHQLDSALHRCGHTPKSDARRLLFAILHDACGLLDIVSVQPTAPSAYEIRPEDLRVETWRKNQGGWGTKPDNCCRITHVPTGTTVTVEDTEARSGFKAKAEAMAKLRVELASKAKHECPTCGRTSQIVELGKKCPFCPAPVTMDATIIEVLRNLLIDLMALEETALDAAKSFEQQYDFQLRFTRARQSIGMILAARKLPPEGFREVGHLQVVPGHVPRLGLYAEGHKLSDKTPIYAFVAPGPTATVVKDIIPRK